MTIECKYRCQCGFKYTTQSPEPKHVWCPRCKSGQATWLNAAEVINALVDVDQLPEYRRIK